MRRAGQGCGSTAATDSWAEDTIDGDSLADSRVVERRARFDALRPAARFAGAFSYELQQAGHMGADQGLHRGGRGVSEGSIQSRAFAAILGAGFEAVRAASQRVGRLLRAFESLQTGDREFADHSAQG